MSIHDLEPHHVYKYFEARSAKVAAKKEIEVLSHLFTKAVEWGELKQHPFKGQVRLENPSQPRDRYVEDWELIELLSMKPRKRKGSLGMVQAYLRGCSQSIVCRRLWYEKEIPQRHQLRKRLKRSGRLCNHCFTLETRIVEEKILKSNAGKHLMHHYMHDACA